jgi:hypothetical protein
MSSKKRTNISRPRHSTRKHAHSHPPSTTMNRRPSIFTTVSGSRYYHDESDGAPIPISTSSQSHRGASGGAILMDDSLQSSLSSHRMSSSHYHSTGGPQPQRNQPAIPRQLSRSNFNTGAAYPYHLQQSQPSSVSHRSQPPFQSVKATPLYPDVMRPLKSIAYLDRIPAPEPPINKHNNFATEPNNIPSSVSAHSTRCLIHRHPNEEQPTDHAQVVEKGIPMDDDIRNVVDPGHPHPILRPFSYHRFVVPCPQCSGSMMVSKQAIVVQCPKCHSICPAEAASSVHERPSKTHPMGMQDRQC